MTQPDFPVELTTTLPLSTTHQPYWQMATSINTRKAYRSDIRHFIRNGGLLPTTTEALLDYLHQQAPFLNPRTLKRRLVAIKQWHIYQHFTDPTLHPLILKTMSGIARTHGKPADKAAPLSVEQLIALASHLNKQGTLIAYRDNALLQIGFLGAFRSSEVVAIQWQHIRFLPEGIEILIPRSKTDQAAEGNICAIPYGQAPLCPITALNQWQTRSGLTEGFVFRALRQGRCDLPRGLSPDTVSQILKRRASECQWPNPEQYSGHSLRRGFATAASQRGASLGAIMRQGRWRHEGTVQGYIEESKRFEANAAAFILDQPTSLPLRAEDRHQPQERGK